VNSQVTPQEPSEAPTASAVAEASQVERALVLSGGGPVGRAWLAGLLSGLIDDGANLSSADLVVGTSAGAIVGAHLTLGLDMVALVAESQRQAGQDIYASAASGLDNLLLEFAKAGAATDPDQARAEIGRKALAAQSIGEEAFLSRPVYAPLAGQAWPAPFRATAVSATTGRLTVWSEHSGVDLGRAVASSSAVPGISPPVTLGADRFMDGSVRSSLNADLATGARHIIVVSCFSLTAPDGIPPIMKRLYDDLDHELDTVRAAGESMEIIEPRPEFLRLSGYGRRLMDTSLVGEAVDVGRRQANHESRRLTSWAPR
jgi:NTE family protein